MIRSSIAPTGRSRRPHLLGLAVFGALLVGACGTLPPSPQASVSASPSSPTAPSSAPATASAASACASADIAAIGGPWGGAAGSRGSDIIVENRGASPCLLPAGATVALVDQGGTALLTSAPVQAGTGPELAPNASMGFSLVFGNWCDQSVSLPLHFRLALATDAIDIDGLAVATTDDLPPCNGPGQPATLSTTAWEPR